jgi:hypothetical protein
MDLNWLQSLDKGAMYLNICNSFKCGICSVEGDRMPSFPSFSTFRVFPPGVCQCSPFNFCLHFLHLFSPMWPHRMVKKLSTTFTKFQQIKKSQHATISCQHVDFNVLLPLFFMLVIQLVFDRAVITAQHSIFESNKKILVETLPYW